MFLPLDDALQQPVFSVEVQFQRDDYLYERLFAELFMSLDQHSDTLGWQAVVIYPRRSVEQEQTHLYQILLDSPQVQRVCLDEITSDEGSLGLGYSG